MVVIFRLYFRVIVKPNFGLVKQLHAWHLYLYLIYSSIKSITNCIIYPMALFYLRWHHQFGMFDQQCYMYDYNNCKCNTNACILKAHSPSKSVSSIWASLVLTYDCWHCFLVSNISVSHALEMIITQPLSCFVFHLPNLLLTQNFVYPTLFSSVPPPAINNDRSLTVAFSHKIENLILLALWVKLCCNLR
jgi:hypothetical protein